METSQDQKQSTLPKFPSTQTHIHHPPSLWSLSPWTLITSAELQSTLRACYSFPSQMLTSTGESQLSPSMENMEPQKREEQGKEERASRHSVQPQLQKKAPKWRKEKDTWRHAQWHPKRANRSSGPRRDEQELPSGNSFVESKGRGGKELNFHFYKDHFIWSKSRTEGKSSARERVFLIHQEGEKVPFQSTLIPPIASPHSGRSLFPLPHTQHRRTEGWLRDGFLSPSPTLKLAMALECRGLIYFTTYLKL